MDELLVKRIHRSAQLPLRAHDGDLGFDLYAAQPAVLPRGDWATVGTGIQIALPLGVAALVMPRSGLAARHGIGVLNSPGLIDSGYRGELGVVLINHGHEPFHVSPGDRIAQLVIVGMHLPQIKETDKLPDSWDGRAQGGFGSSGA